MSGKSVAILGGGISGLSAAHYLLKSCRQNGVSLSKVYLIESKPRFGGWLQTVRNEDPANPNNNSYFELGPRTISLNSYAGSNALVLVRCVLFILKMKFICHF